MLLSNEQSVSLIERAKTKIVGRNPFPNFQTRAQKKHFAKVRRIILLSRRSSPTSKNAPRKKAVKCQYNKLLNSFLPHREKIWIPPHKRKGRQTFVFNKFSFVDSPQETLQLFQNLVSAEAKARGIVLNFLDDNCLDIAPYMVLALMRSDMAPVILGGRIRGTIYNVFKAVNMLGELKINPLEVPDDNRVLPFKMFSRYPRGHSHSSAYTNSWTTDEKAAERFSDTFNTWLGKLSPPMELTDGAYAYVSTLFSELLDNATRHSDLIGADGGWHIAGFMETLDPQSPGNNSDQIKYVCHFAIISLGNTIYESLQTAQASMKQAIERYCEKINSQLPRSKRIEREVLWNVCAMQDGISRVHQDGSNTKNGFGMASSLSSLTRAFANPQDIDNTPKMTIISGQSCIMIKYPYNVFTEKDGKRILAFNPPNSLDNPPDATHVLSLEQRFPGTLITVRFVMDNDHLTGVVDRDETNASA